MKILYLSNYLNHHQAPLAEAFSKIEGIDYIFISFGQMSAERVAMGYKDYSEKSYLLKANENDGNLQKAIDLLKTADVAIFGGITNMTLEDIRLQKGLLTFEASERWFKRGWINFISPRLLKSQWYYHTKFYNKSLYKLCSSAFTANDMYTLHSFKDRCFKWGYFPEVGNNPFETSTEFSIEGTVRIMWCARFLHWKHPELALRLAQSLMRKGYDFQLSLFGDGSIWNDMKSLAKKLAIDKKVHFWGNKPNEEILCEMRKHDIFLFTSDQHEGWGAVANEAMSNGCTLVSSNKIGSTPYLIKNGYNGMIFESENLRSLEEKVIYLIEHPKERRLMAQRAYESMKEIWSPGNAAKSFVQLVDDIKNGRECSIKDGPCSKAIPVKALN